MTYPRTRLKVGDSAGHALIVHPKTAEMHGLADRSGRRIHLRCAARRTTVTVEVDERIAPGCWSLSAAALSDLALTASVVRRLRFRMKWDGPAAGEETPCASVGPIIGVLVGKERRHIRQNRHGFPLLDLVWNVERMGGLVYFFAADDIDWKGRSIAGFVHVPDKVKWEEGTFPYPGAIYRRWPIPKQQFDRIVRDVTPRVFNVYASNKLAQARILRRDARTAALLPETRPLDSKETLDDMLERYGAVYVKNTSVGAGKGVFRVERFRGGFSVRARDRSRRPDEMNAWAGGFGALADYVTGKTGRPLDPRRWAVQQAISLARLKGRRVDFRVTVQKDGLGRWEVRGGYARSAPSEEAVITRLGAYRKADAALRALWPRRWRSIRSEMDRCAVLLCERLEDGFGLLGDVGVDFALDPWGNMWFLEANPGPGYRPVSRSDEEYWRQVHGPVEYASYLSGFGIVSK